MAGHPDFSGRPGLPIQQEMTASALSLRRVRWALRSVALVVLAVVSLAVPDISDPQPAAADPVSDARGALEAAQANAGDAARRLEATMREHALAQEEILRIEVEIPVLVEQEADLRSIMADRAAALYRSAGSESTLEDLAEGDPVDAARRAELNEAVTAHDRDIADELVATVEELTTTRENLKARKAELETLTVQITEERQDLEKKVILAEHALWRAEEIAALRATGDTPLLGPSILTPEEIASWFRSQGGRATVAGLPILEIAKIYVEEGEAAGVRGDIAFAQSIIETGSFTQTGPNNFAGLGACDSCASMTNFPTPRDGIRAQVQHLRNYGDPFSRSDQLTNPPSPDWYGSDPATAAGNFDSFFHKGVAPTWEQMGAGHWATDPDYAGKVIAVYDRMLSASSS